MGGHTVTRPLNSPEVVLTTHPGFAWLYVSLFSGGGEKDGRTQCIDWDVSFDQIVSRNTRYSGLLVSHPLDPFLPDQLSFP
jgi:hypothetical protein